MKRYYVMIEAGRLFNEDSQLYKFKVGVTHRDHQALNVVQKYAIQHDYFVEEWTVQTRDFVFKLAKSIGRNFLQLNWNYMEVGQMAKCIRQCNSLPRKNYLTPHEVTVRRMMCSLLPN